MTLTDDGKAPLISQAEGPRLVALPGPSQTGGLGKGRKGKILPVEEGRDTVLQIGILKKIYPL